MYQVYGQYNDEGILLRIENAIPEGEGEAEGWVLLDEGEGFAHAQNNYLDGPIGEPGGVYRYKRGPDGKPVERTEEEKTADRAVTLPVPMPERVAELEEALLVSYLAQAELYEKALLLEEEGLVTMMAVADLYETMIGGM